MASHKLNVTIVSPHHTVFHGTATAISLKNELGPFDILPEHANFISTIEEFVILRQGSQQQRLPINRGIVYCRENIVKIFVGLQPLAS